MENPSLNYLLKFRSRMKALIFMLSTFITSCEVKAKNLEKDTDLYVLSLHWPYTKCLLWKNLDQEHRCNNIGRFNPIYV